MNCRDFEQILESYLAGELGSGDLDSADRHLRNCDICTDLLALARIAHEPSDRATARPPRELLIEVLRQTTGSSCTAAERMLCDYADRRLADELAELVAGHLDGCDECRGLAGALTALSVDLPRLAEIQPDSGFVDSVLAATLPLQVRLRRWWQRSWPRWVERPRFAAEAAYVTTLVLVLIFSVPGSPLEAMPRQAVEMARRTAPTTTVGDPWGRLEAAILPKLRTLKEAEGTRAVFDSWRTTVELGSRGVDRSLEIGGEALSWASTEIRTLWDALASVLERADETPSSADQDPDEETS